MLIMASIDTGGIKL